MLDMVLTIPMRVSEKNKQKFIVFAMFLYSERICNSNRMPSSAVNDKFDEW